MSVTSLLNLSVRRVMSCIFEGTLPSTAHQLDPDLSNLLFEEYCRIFDVELTRSVVKDICSLLNVTKINMWNCLLDRKELIILKNMNLISLAMGDLTALGPNKTESNEPIKLDAMLKKCLNERTLRELLHLDLSSIENEFLNGWAESISKLLPSLISFTVRRRSLSLSEFGSICSRFTNLRSLDISDTGLTTLEGISNLKNIEILSIGGLKYLISLSIVEIFELKKIRVLELSSKNSFDQKTWLFRSFSFCNKVLPELRSIDLSGTCIALESLDCLIKTHPNLQQIGLLATHCDDFQSTVSPDLKILTCKNLTASTQSLKYYLSLKNYISVRYILERTISVLYGQLDEESDSSIKEWFYTICETIDKFSVARSINIQALKCLHQICRKDRILRIPVPERHKLVDLLFKICDEWPDYKDNEIETELIENVWKILDNEWLLSTTYLNIQKIFENAMEYGLIERARTIKKVCMKIMNYTFDIMEPEVQKEMFGNLEICQDLIDSLHVFYKRKQFKKYQFVQKFIVKMVELRPENFVKVGGVSILVRHLKSCIQVESLKILKVLALSVNSECIRELSTPENVRRLVHYLKICKPTLTYYTNIMSLNENIFLVCCILSVIVYSIDENRFNSLYWRSIIKLLKEILTTLAEEPGYPCVHLEEVFETFFEKRTKDVKQGPIQMIQCHRDEKGACFYC